MSAMLSLPHEERTVIVDIIRGFALVGVLIANFTSYSVQSLPEDVFENISSDIDKILVALNAIFIEWKFITIFSILFGYGFGLLLNSLERKNIPPTGFFIRRMTWLFVFGVIHTLFWRDDVLHLYAICGIFLLLFRNSSTRAVLVCSFLFMFLLPPVISLLFSKPSYYTDENLRVLYDNYRYGNIFEVFQMNIVFYYNAFILSGADIRDNIEILGRFLFGYYLIRIEFFKEIGLKKGVIRKLLMITAPLMIAYFILRYLSIREMIDASGFFWSFFNKTGIFATSLFYTSILVLLFISNSHHKVFTTLQYLGKMTLTNYLLISVFMVVLLYGIGFGALGVLSMKVIWLLALVWLFFEILLSTFWLQKFRYGPMEWIWRQLTYKQRIQLRK